MPKVIHYLGGVLVLIIVASSCASKSETGTIAREVRAMGYGNWIVVADASYPFQESEGYRTVVVDGEIPAVVDQVLIAMEEIQHTRPNFFLSRELRSVQNDQAPGIDFYRQELEKAMHGYNARELEMSLLNNLVSQTSEKFTVLVLKTQTTLPYSTVFLELDSGYWNNQAEQELRAIIQAQDTPVPLADDQ